MSPPEISNHGQEALETAEAVIESESTIPLTQRESLRLLEMIESPPPRNAKFLQAQARYQERKNDPSKNLFLPL
jgi:uncharacterized protein (DUF1778 family)